MDYRYSLCGECGLNLAARRKLMVIQEDFYPCRATPEAKNKFIKTIFGYDLMLGLIHSSSLIGVSRSRSLKRTRDAAQQFTLVARGLEGSAFGYATVTM